MASIPDVEPCTYFELPGESLGAVGWLGAQSEFEKGTVHPEFFSRLSELARDPWQPVMVPGFHHCELRQFNPPHFSNNTFIPYGGVIYVAPVGIVHYVEAHWYKPPSVFVEAVLPCPPMRTMEYRRAFLANGGREILRRLGA